MSMNVGWELVVRVEKPELGRTLGIGIQPIQETEKHPGIIVVSVEPASRAFGKLLPGDRIVAANGVPAINRSKLMEGLTVEGEGWALHMRPPGILDLLVVRNIFAPPHTFALCLPRGAESSFTLEPDGVTVCSVSRDEWDLEPGDFVLSVDGQPLAPFSPMDTLYPRLVSAEGDDGALLQVRRGAPPLGSAFESTPMRLFCLLWLHPSSEGRPTGLFVDNGKEAAEPIVAVYRSSPSTMAAQAGFQALDRLVLLDWAPVESAKWVEEIVAGRGHSVIVERSLSVSRLCALNLALWPAMASADSWPTAATPPDISKLRDDLAVARRVPAKGGLRKPSILHAAPSASPTSAPHKAPSVTITDAPPEIIFVHEDTPVKKASVAPAP